MYREFLPRYGERANRARVERCRRKVSKWKPRYRRSVTQKAIEYADDDYRLKKLHDTIDEDAFNARQMRRGEILGLLATEAPYCPKHSVKMICPKCVASSGGRRTTTKYRDRLSSWGKMGGRGKRKGFSLCPASTASDFARTLEQSSRKRKAAR